MRSAPCRQEQYVRDRIDSSAVGKLCVHEVHACQISFLVVSYGTFRNHATLGEPISWSYVILKYRR